MTDRVKMYFIHAPEVEVVLTAPCIYAQDGVVIVDLTSNGTDIQGYPYSALLSFHITKEIPYET